MHDEKERERGRNMGEGAGRKGTREGERLRKMKEKRDEVGGWDRE